MDGSGITERPRASHQTGKDRALAASPGARPQHLGESNPPPGTHGRRDVSELCGVPSRDEDLYGHYRHRFEEAVRDFWQTERLCAMAERDWWREVKGNRTPFNEDGPARDKRILRDYEGVPSWTVATFEDCHPRHVEKLRREALLDSETGRKVQMDERTRRIVELKREGKTQRSIATIIGVNASTVCRVLQGAA